MTQTRTRLAAVLALAGLSLTACASSPKTNPAREARTPTSLYPLHAEATPDRIALALHPEGLSPAQVQALGELAQRWRSNQGGPLRLSLPHGGVDPGLANRTAASAHQMLLLQGVPDGAIQSISYETSDPQAPLLVSFVYDKAVAPDCGSHWDDLTHNADNHVQSNFGCATSANMAAQIANPSDIRRPRAEDAPDSERRLDVMAKYQAGKATAAEDAGAKGALVSGSGQ